MQANREQTVRSHPVLHLPGDTRLVPERLWRVEAWRRRQIRYQGHLGEVVPVIFPGPPTRAEPGRRSTGWKEAMNSLPVHLQDSETPAFSSQVNRPSLGRDEGQAQHQAHWELRETPSSPRDPPPSSPPAHNRAYSGQSARALWPVLSRVSGSPREAALSHFTGDKRRFGESTLSRIRADKWKTLTPTVGALSPDPLLFCTPAALREVPTLPPRHPWVCPAGGPGPLVPPSPQAGNTRAGLCLHEAQSPLAPSPRGRPHSRRSKGGSSPGWGRREGGVAGSPAAPAPQTPRLGRGPTVLKEPPAALRSHTSAGYRVLPTPTTGELEALPTSGTPSSQGLDTSRNRELITSKVIHHHVGFLLP